MTVIQGKGSVSKVTIELKYLINSTWDWQVKKLGTNEFMFVVPSAKDLEFLTKLKEFKCKISYMVVSVERSDLMVGCCDILSTVWVCSTNGNSMLGSEGKGSGGGGISSRGF
jgi:hypothetical protein